MCNIVVHEACLERLQQHIKCKLTFREANSKPRRSNSNQSSSTHIYQHATHNNTSTTKHHWVWQRYDEKKSDTHRCQACLKVCYVFFYLFFIDNILF